MDSSVDISPTELSQQARGAGEAASAKPKELSTPPQSNEHSYIQNLVSQNHVVVFSKTHCPHCTSSKSLLSDLGVAYTTVELDEVQHGSQLQNVLGSITDARTVPRIFIDGQCVGGNSELRTLDKTGKLVQLLKKA